MPMSRRAIDTVVMCHLGNIATRVGRTLRWDPKKEEIIGDKRGQRVSVQTVSQTLDARIVMGQ